MAKQRKYRAEMKYITYATWEFEANSDQEAEEMCEMLDSSDLDNTDGVEISGGGCPDEIGTLMRVRPKKFIIKGGKYVQKGGK